jgi:cyclase
MKLQQVSDGCYAVLDERNRLRHANSGLINLGGGAVIDPPSDLSHARRMIELFSRVWPGMPKHVVNTHEDGGHAWGNRLFQGAEIIEHRTVGERGSLDLDGTEVRLIHVGPCHQLGDTIVHVPKERVVFAGDVIFRECTPIGWNGSYAKWFQALDLIAWLDPDVIVPGHGPVCGIEGAMEMKAYLEYVREESRTCFDEGLSALEASKKIDLGPYAGWKGPARMYMNVERAYREFRNEAADAPWDRAKTFDAMRAVAKARSLEVEF